MKRILALCSLVVAAGTASGAMAASDDVIAATFRRPPPGALVLLLLQKSTEPHVVPGDPMLLAQLKSQLTSAGYRTAVLDYGDYQLLEADEAVAGGELDKDGKLVVGLLARQRALARLAKIAAESSHCDLVVRARFVFRRAPIVNSVYAQWDGARHGLKFEDATVIEDPEGRHVVFASMSGTAMALSVELMAYDAVGKLAFTTHGAVIVPYVTNINKTSTRWLDTLFESDSDVADGLRIALAPMRELSTPGSSPDVVSAAPMAVGGRPARIQANAPGCRPEYPASAVRVRAQGVTRLRFTVDADGQKIAGMIVGSAGDLPEHKMLDRAALDGLGRCKFEPGQDPDGTAVSSETEVEYRWVLQ